MERPRWRFTGSYRFTDRLQAGLEWNPAAKELGFIGNYTILRESETQPLLNLGTSSDRIGTPAGPRAYYLTVAKTIPGSQLSPYVSLNYSEFDRGFNFPFGVSYSLDDRLSLMAMNDGRKSHLLLAVSERNWSITAMWIWLKKPGLSVSIGF